MKNGKIVKNGSEQWYKDDLLHREDGPAYIKNYPNGERVVKYYIEGVQHREDGPADIQYNENGNVEIEEWYKNGDLHREGGPAEIQYDDDGTVVFEGYWINGVQHREDGPAIISDYNGSKLQEWWVNGEKHRLDGPAVAHPDPLNMSPKWWLYGEPFYKEEDFRKKRKELQVKQDIEDLKGSGSDEEDIDLMKTLGMFESKILDFKSFKKINK